MKGPDPVVGKAVTGKKNDTKEKSVGIERMGAETLPSLGFKQNGSELSNSEFQAPRRLPTSAHAFYSPL